MLWKLSSQRPAPVVKQRTCRMLTLTVVTFSTQPDHGAAVDIVLAPVAAPLCQLSSQTHVLWTRIGGCFIARGLSSMAQPRRQQDTQLPARHSIDRRHTLKGIHSKGAERCMLNLPVCTDTDAAYKTRTRSSPSTDMLAHTRRSCCKALMRRQLSEKRDLEFALGIASPAALHASKALHGQLRAMGHG